MPRTLPPGARLVLATHNGGKLREIADLLPGYDLVSAGALGLPEPDEDAPDFAGNARIKALASAHGAGLPALADDSGFCVAALGGAPGVHSARWALLERGGPGKDFAPAMERVWREAQASGAQPDLRAWFVCALCLAWPDGHTDTFVGRVGGMAVWPPRGSLGFGYDPMFVPDGVLTGAAGSGLTGSAGSGQTGSAGSGLTGSAGSGQTGPAGSGLTFGEMDPGAKHAVSHRARAMEQLRRGCLG